MPKCEYSFGWREVKGISEQRAWPGIERLDGRIAIKPGKIRHHHERDAKTGGYLLPRPKITHKEERLTIWIETAGPATLAAL